MKNQVVKVETGIRHKVAYKKKFSQFSNNLSGKTHSLFVYDRGHKLTFREITAYFHSGDKNFKFAVIPKNKDVKHWELIAKNGKFYLYERFGKRWQGRVYFNFDFSNYCSQVIDKDAEQPVFNESFIQEEPLWNGERLNPSLSFKSDEESKFYRKIRKSLPFKVYHARINRILKEFAKRNGSEAKIVISQDCSKNIELLCYPLLTKVPYYKICAGSSNHFRHCKDFKEVVKKCFGSDGKKIYKMVWEIVLKIKNYRILTLGTILKGLIPVDYFYDIIPKIETLYFPTKKERLLYQKFFGNFSKERLKTLLTNELFLRRNFYFTDTISMYEKYSRYNLPFPDLNNWEKLHDFFSFELTKLKDPNFEIKPLKSIEKVDGSAVDDMVIRAPKSYYELIEWSQKMRNCISGYAERARDKRVVLLGVFKKEEILYNISINNKSLSQFYAVGNQLPDENDKIKVLKFLKEKDILEEMVEAA